MIEKPAIFEGDGVTIFKNSNSKILENMKEFRRGGEVRVCIKQNKVISQNMIPGYNFNSAKQSFFSKDAAWDYVISQTETKITDLQREGLIVKDNSVTRVLEYAAMYPYMDKSNNVHFVGVVLNSGYKLNMDWVVKKMGSLNVDIVEEVKKLFGLAKSYWNLKKDDAAGDKVAIDKLEADIIVPPVSIISSKMIHTLFLTSSSN